MGRRWQIGELTCVDSGQPFALQPSDLASHESRDQRWQIGSAQCRRNGNGQHIPVGHRWSYADVTSSRHRRVSLAIRRTRPWSALPTLQLNSVQTGSVVEVADWYW